MSLNAEELRRTRDELRANLELSGLTEAEACADLAYSAPRLAAVLLGDGSADPVDVWQVRDYLQRAVTDSGREPRPFTVLTERSRIMARMWFRLRPAPRHDFTASRSA